MLKNIIEQAVQIETKKQKEEEAQKKGEDKAPFQYNNELEISVFKKDELVEHYTNK